MLNPPLYIQPYIKKQKENEKCKDLWKLFSKKSLRKKNGRLKTVKKCEFEPSSSLSQTFSKKIVGAIVTPQKKKTNK